MTESSCVATGNPKDSRNSHFGTSMTYDIYKCRYLTSPSLPDLELTSEEGDQECGYELSYLHYITCRTMISAVHHQSLKAMLRVGGNAEHTPILILFLFY
jgi:hypothetical protein